MIKKIKKKHRIFFLVCILGQVNLINSGIRDFFVNVPAALAFSFVGLGRWYLNSVQIADMKKMRAELDQSNKNLALTGTCHHRVMTSIAAVTANQAEQNKEARNNALSLASTQRCFVDIQLRQGQLHEVVTSIKTQLEDTITNLGSLKKEHASIINIQSQTDAILAEMAAKMQAGSSAELRQREQFQAKMRMLETNQAGLREAISRSTQDQAGLRLAVTEAGGHLESMRAKCESIGTEQSALQKILQGGLPIESAGDWRKTTLIGRLLKFNPVLPPGAK